MENPTPFPSMTKLWHQKPQDFTTPEKNPAVLPTGKVVLITGGGKGVGKNTAEAFVRNGAKAVIITGRHKDTLDKTVTHLQSIASKGTIVRSFAFDVTDVAATQSMLKTVLKEVGKIDTVICNAGYLNDHGTVVDSDLNDIWKAWEVNVKAPLILYQELHRTGAAASNVTIITINTGAAQGTMAPFATYSASKAASARYIEYLHQEQPNWRVFSLHPGILASDMQVKSGMPSMDDATITGPFCMWLANDKRSDFLRGRFLWTNWDIPQLMEQADEIVKGDKLKLVVAM